MALRCKISRVKTLKFWGFLAREHERAQLSRRFAPCEIFDSEQLGNGQTLVTIVNSDVKGKRVEVDDGVFKRATRVVINDWDSVHSNAQIGLLEAIKQGVLREEAVYTLGDVVTKKAPGRISSKEILYYKNNVGLGMQFAAAGGLVYKKMRGVAAKLEFPTDWGERREKLISGLFQTKVY